MDKLKALWAAASTRTEKKNRSSRPSVDDWQGLHNISWINNGEKKSLNVQKFSSFPLKTNCQNRTKVLKNKQTKKNTETLLVLECSAQIKIWPQQGTAFFQEQKQNLILWRCGEKSWPVQLITGSRSRHELKLIHNVVELHSGLGKTLKSNLETSLKKKASTISW